MKKILRISGFVILIALAIFIYFRYFWVFGEGVKAGELNYVVKKGYIFKTYEGNLIQSGFKGSTSGTIQSYEFRFSVVDESIAQKMMANSGKEFKLHYKEYKGTVPWRGVTVFIVDSIYDMRDAKAGPGPF